jgi:hypothetical protein
MDTEREHKRRWAPQLSSASCGFSPGQPLLASLGTSQLSRPRFEHHREDYPAEITGRIGRSILHELSDADLERLVAELRGLLPDGPLVEQDRWTLWQATSVAG